ncbi:DUF6776 family protein [Alteromonas sp. CYL-A6]|uniref:DUF6776 family protein n=1 Tax=Alteromonas nitratireducens TaxID=3390813 RepID=UPI0034B202C1
MNTQHPSSGVQRLVLLAALSAMVFFGYQLANFFHANDNSKVAAQSQTISFLKNENQALIRQLHETDVQLELAKMEAEQLLAAQNELKAKLEEATTRLAFYQHVMAPEHTQDGFFVDGVEVIPAASTGYFRLRFVLLQQRQNKAVVKGDLAIAIEGSRDGAPYTLEAGTDAFLPDGGIKYRFKYFQPVSFEFRLPDNFVPEYLRFTTTVYQYTTRRGDYQVNISWEEALSGVNAGTGD